jgi:glutamine synthetase
VAIQREQEAIDYVLHSARENDVKFVRLWFTDILGTLKGVATTIEELEDAMTRGVGFDGSSILGFARVDESDMVALPDPNTFRILPWRPRENAVARMFCDILTPQGEPFEGDPRYVLKRNLARASQLGLTFYVGPELEYFYFENSESLIPLDQGDYFDQTIADLSTDLRRETVLNLADIGIPVKYSHHEAAPSQHEIVLQHTDGLTMADSVMTARLVIKEVAMRNGKYATFMPKPLDRKNGSGMHLSLSLFQGEQNAFYDFADSLKLSELANRFMAGLLRHAPELTLITNQWVNSYKRLVPGYEAPIYISWASLNRSDLIRIPAYKAGREDAVRLEYRAPDAACNPYLAFSVLLAAGLAGVEQRYSLPEAVNQDVSAMSDSERAARGITSLPGSLSEAINLASESAIVRDALGEHLLSMLITNKRIEWEQYRTHVSNYEVSKYLPTL